MIGRIATRTVRSAAMPVRRTQQLRTYASAPQDVAAKAGEAASKASEAASSVASKASDVASKASDAASHATAKVAGGSDAPWAITSLLVFGALGIYLTSPSKDDHGHGHGGDHHGSEPKNVRVDDASAGLDLGEVAKSKTESKEQHEDAPEGNKHLASQSHDVETGAVPKQKTSGEPNKKSSGDNTTFQQGIAAAKEGHKGGENSHISDPKKVVAAAKTKKEEQKDEVE